VGTVVAVVGVLTWTAGWTLRGLAAGHWPLATTFEFTLAWAAAAAATTLLLEFVSGTPTLGAFCLPVAAGIAAYALFGSPPGSGAPQPLPPALDSPWLLIHVAVEAAGYGGAAVAAGAGALALVARVGTDRLLLPVSAATPAQADRLVRRAVAWAYPWLSLGLVAGAIWAQVAWGRYWNWDLKETWALVSWLVYTLVLHVAGVPRWRGWPVAVLNLVGFGVVLFTFLGVGPLARMLGLTSLHVY
jgi:cytochrome c-type biogenesis protein CcsB